MFFSFFGQIALVRTLCRCLHALLHRAQCVCLTGEVGYRKACKAVECVCVLDLYSTIQLVPKTHPAPPFTKMHFYEETEQTEGINYNILFIQQLNEVKKVKHIAWATYVTTPVYSPVPNSPPTRRGCYKNHDWLFGPGPWSFFINRKNQC